MRSVFIPIFSLLTASQIIVENGICYRIDDNNVSVIEDCPLQNINLTSTSTSIPTSTSTSSVSMPTSNSNNGNGNGINVVMFSGMLASIFAVLF